MTSRSGSSMCMEGAGARQLIYENFSLDPLTMKPCPIEHVLCPIRHGNHVQILLAVIYWSIISSGACHYLLNGMEGMQFINKYAHPAVSFDTLMLGKCETRSTILLAKMCTQ